MDHRAPSKLISDPNPVAAYLNGKLPGEWDRLSVSQLVGGQSNPTFLLTAGAHRYVLRTRPPGSLLRSAHAIDREYRVLNALRNTGVPVPYSHLYCDDGDILGTDFYVMDYVPGRVFRNPLLPELSPSERSAVYDSMNATIANLHSADAAALGLADFGRPGNYYARQIDRWTQQYRATEIDRIPSMECLIEWLPHNIPPSDRAGLVHGDFRLENLIFHPTEPRVVAVLDWELSTLGDPLGDLAYNCLPWRLPPQAFGGLAGVDLHRSGVPGEQAYLSLYCRRSGLHEVASWPFYVGFALFRLAAILQGVLNRALAGNASSPDAEQRGRLAPLCADAGWRTVARADLNAAG